MELWQTIYTHEKFTESKQYWCPESEEYAAASQLLSALRDGWVVALPSVQVRQIWNSGSRPRRVYDFTLLRDAQLMIMPVLTNPFIERFIAQKGIRLQSDQRPEPLALPE